MWPGIRKASQRRHLIWTQGKTGKTLIGGQRKAVPAQRTVSAKTGRCKHTLRVPCDLALTVFRGATGNRVKKVDRGQFEKDLLHPAGNRAPIGI